MSLLDDILGRGSAGNSGESRTRGDTASGGEGGVGVETGKKSNVNVSQDRAAQGGDNSNVASGDQFIYTDESVDYTDNSTADNSVTYNDESVTDNSVSYTDDSFTDQSVSYNDESTTNTEIDNSVQFTDNSVRTTTVTSTDYGAVDGALGLAESYIQSLDETNRRSLLFAGDQNELIGEAYADLADAFENANARTQGFAGDNVEFIGNLVSKENDKIRDFLGEQSETTVEKATDRVFQIAIAMGAILGIVFLSQSGVFKGLTR